MFGNPTIVDAILDRLVHNAYRIEFKGERASESKSNPLQINRSLDLLIPQRHDQIDPCD